MATTTAMDAMIDSFREASLAFEQVSSQTEILHEGAELPSLKPMVLGPSALCMTCRTVFDQHNYHRSLNRLRATGDTLSSLSHNDRILPHHSIESLANEAKAGCHLCLVIYLGLNEEALKEYARSLKNPKLKSARKDSLTSDRFSQCSLGFASVQPATYDQARLKFWYIEERFLNQSCTQTSQSIDLGAQLRSSAATSFDYTNHELRSQSVGDCPKFPVSMSPQPFGFQTEINAKLLSRNSQLSVDLALLKLRHALDLDLQTDSIKSANTASTDSLAIAKNWIHDCEMNHSPCIMVGNSHWKPTYLLDISAIGSDSSSGIKLVDGATVSPSSEYVTLSHSGTSTTPIQLNKKTMVTLKQGVVRSNLPKTLSETVLVVRKLGYRYLWIDVLCIPHDGERAVLNEMSQMHKIYGHAALNIAATSARGDTGGLIRSRNTTALQPCVLDLRGHDIEDGTYMAVRTSTWIDLVEKAPLQERAWVLQERALARRTLHFTQSEIMWECPHMRCSETYPRGFPKELEDFSHLDAEQAETPSLGFDKVLYHSQKVNWGPLIQLYSQGLLNFQSDKLVAISGLARQYMVMNNLKETDYVAGFWKYEFPLCLLWRVHRGQRMMRYRAPSWSWASVDGLVKYYETPRRSFRSCLDIIDISLKHKYDDLMGLCQSARLKVSAFLARGLLQRQQDYWGETSCTIRQPKSHVQMDFEHTSFDEELPRSVLEPLEMYIMPLLYTPGTVEGLLLTLTAVKGELKRLGTFTLPVTDNRNMCDKFSTVMKEHAGLTSYEERLEYRDKSVWFAGRYKYIITLV